MVFQEKMTMLQKIVEDHFKVRIKTKSRKKKFTVPRMIFCYVAIEILNYRQKDVVNYTGLNHATVYHAVNTVKNDLKTYKYFKDIYYKFLSDNLSEITNLDINCKTKVINILLRQVLNLLKDVNISLNKSVLNGFNDVVENQANKLTLVN
jgi:hypothetical protein